MPLKLNKPAYVKLIKEDLEWLLQQPRTLERDHIEDVLNWSINATYPTETNKPLKRENHDFKPKSPDGIDEALSFIHGFANLNKS